jgi:hypothetical protein
MVEFDPITHTYYVDGEEREGVSHYIERHKTPFPKEFIAQKTAQRDNREVEDILSEWELKGRVSREYGTAVHSAIEGFIRYGITPKNRHLRAIVESFQKLGLKDLQTEFVTYHETLAGTIDIIERTDKGVCNIYDIKTNHDLHKKGKKMLPPYEHLTDSPIDCYQLQLSLYADMMEHHKWKVEKLFILHVVDEEIKKIKVKRL